MSDFAQEEAARVQEWIERLEAFVASLDGVEGDDAVDLTHDAFEAWQNLAGSSLTEQSPSALLIFEALNVLAKVAAIVAVDWVETPDARDRHTPDSAQRLVKDGLEGVLCACKRWLSTGLPSSEDVCRRFAAAATEVQESMRAMSERSAEMDAQDARADVDPYGAILIHHVPERPDVAAVFTKVCSFTEEDNTRYAEAHDRLRRMIDSELSQHISDEGERLCDVLIGVLTELRDRQLSLNDFDAVDERRRRIRSALISFTAALQIHEYQTVRGARQTLGLDRSEVDKIKELFEDFKKKSFEYRWLEALRDALQHGDINAFNWSFKVSVRSQPEVTITVNRAFLLEFFKENRKKPWLKRRELENLTSDPSVLHMIASVQPVIGSLQEKLDKILYPDVAHDAATVRELISRFEGKEGVYCLQTGPGLTRRRLAPPHSRLAPRVLTFAENYGKEG
ncbi:hypothetical protein [Nocardia rhamnosiphila]